VTRVLYLYGGWPGHIPYEVAPWLTSVMAELGFDVEQIQDPYLLDRDLTGYDLIVNGWTQAVTTEDLSDSVEQRLREAVEQGTGYAGYHGSAAAFRASLQLHLVSGASFIEHPGGEGVDVPYEVRIVDRDHEVTQGIDDFQAASEQYYMHVDPNVHVLAETTFSGEHFPWLDGARMPVAFVHRWGEGRVFYQALGHLLKDLQQPEVERLMRQGLTWTAREGS
jgi:type 1 glutamine amidotransferase